MDVGIMNDHFQTWQQSYYCYFSFIPVGAVQPFGISISVPSHAGLFVVLMFLYRCLGILLCYPGQQ